MKRAFLAALVLAGCATSPTQVDVVQPVTQCLLKGGLPVTIWIDKDARPVRWTCQILVHEPKPDARS